LHADYASCGKSLTTAGVGRREGRRHGSDRAGVEPMIDATAGGSAPFSPPLSRVWRFKQGIGLSGGGIAP